MIPEQDFLEGQFLVAMPHMGDVRFENTIIYVCAHNAEGAMGFVVNKSLPDPKTSDFLKKLGIVTEADFHRIPKRFLHSVLNTGGPVEPGRGFVLHSADFVSSSTIKVSGEVSLTATLEILHELATGHGPKQFFLALGYSGWSAGQLEDEIAANGWLTCKHDASIIFDTDNASKYHRIMQSMGIDPRLISGETGHA